MFFIFESDKFGIYILFVNFYVLVGMWENVLEMRKLMKEYKVKKEFGMSWVEVKNKVYIFIVGDKSYLRREEIYVKLNEIRDLMIKVGYDFVVEIDFYDVDRSEKELLLFYYSEKFVVVFVFIVIFSGVFIRVKKNFRICVDCYIVFKFICEIVFREIIVRDVNRYYYFKDGFCFCGDYW